MPSGATSLDGGVGAEQPNWDVTHYVRIILRFVDG
jgi:hypothetical protein